MTRSPLCFICLISAATRGRYKIDHKIMSWKIVSRSLTKHRPTFAAGILLEIWNKWLINFLWMCTTVTENRTWICMLRWKLIRNTVRFWITGLKSRSLGLQSWVLCSKNHAKNGYIRDTTSSTGEDIWGNCLWYFYLLLHRKPGLQNFISRSWHKAVGRA